MARSWLNYGTPININYAKPEFDIIVIKQKMSDPGPEKINFRGHVGYFSSLIGNKIYILGANQSNTINTTGYSKSLLLGVRRFNPSCS
jgi:hypothetical protein